MAWPAHTAPASGAYSNPTASEQRPAAKIRRWRWVDRFKLFSELSQRQYYKPGCSHTGRKKMSRICHLLAMDGESLPSRDFARTVAKNGVSAAPVLTCGGAHRRLA